MTAAPPAIAPGATAPPSPPSAVQSRPAHITQANKDGTLVQMWALLEQEK